MYKEHVQSILVTANWIYEVPDTIVMSTFLGAANKKHLYFFSSLYFLAMLIHCFLRTRSAAIILRQKLVAITQ